MLKPNELSQLHRDGQESSQAGLQQQAVGFGDSGAAQSMTNQNQSSYQGDELSGEQQFSQRDAQTGTKKQT